MNITVTRFEFGTNYTISKMLLDGVYECYVLEDVVRPAGATKVPGQTAIPAGTYQVVINYSPKFQRDMPELLDVPNFEGVRIHWGNTDVDTEGCLLVGQTWAGGDFIGNSRAAFESFYSKLYAAITNNETVTLTLS